MPNKKYLNKIILGDILEVLPKIEQQASKKTKKLRNKCKYAVEARNDVVHRGKEMRKEDAVEYVEAIHRMIDYLDSNKVLCREQEGGERRQNGS